MGPSGIECDAKFYEFSVEVRCGFRPDFIY